MGKRRFAINDTLSVGEGASTALNVLIGANTEKQYNSECEKIEILNNTSFPISIITDLSLFSPKGRMKLWQKVVDGGRYAAGTVPVYQAVTRNHIIHQRQLTDIIQEQAEGGVKLITIHPTPDRNLLEMSKLRRVPITSRGGAAVCADLILNRRAENVYMLALDDIIKISRVHHITLSIGSSFRSANLYDAIDKTYLYELSKQIEIAEYCYHHGVNVIVETPGHASPQNLFRLCEKLKYACPFPIMPLGPLPTDCALDQDDYAASVGAVLMGTRDCADILSVVTKDEHTGGVPTIDSIISALEKYSVAKHIIDIYKLQDTQVDDAISLQRSTVKSCIFEPGKNCDRCGALCPLKAKDLFEFK